MSVGVANAATVATISSSPLETASGAGTSATCNVKNVSTATVSMTLTIVDAHGVKLPLYTGAPDCTGTLAAGQTCFTYTVLDNTTLAPVSCSVSSTATKNLRAQFVVNNNVNAPIAASELR